MTNAEKFVEVFGLNHDDAEVCPYDECIHQDDDYVCMDCCADWWASEYKEVEHEAYKHFSEEKDCT